MLRECLSDEPGGRLVGRRAPIRASSSGVKDGMLSRPIVGNRTRANVLCQRPLVVQGLRLALHPMSLLLTVLVRCPLNENCAM